jgi:hypothetical protein
MTYTLSIGSVSSGTLRSEDLLDAFARELRQIAKHEDHPGNKAGIEDLLSEIDAIEDYDTDEADDLVDDCIDYLNEYCPPYCYFGANEGDGADFGCWPMDIYDIQQEMFTVSDPSELDDLDYDETEALHVNDHGNVTLYARGAAGRWYEVWSIV